MHRYFNQGSVEIFGKHQPLLIEVVRDFVSRRYDNLGDQHHMVHQYTHGVDPSKDFDWDKQIEVTPVVGENYFMPSPKTMLLLYFNLFNREQMANTLTEHYCERMDSQLADFVAIGKMDGNVEVVYKERGLEKALDTASKAHSKNPKIDFDVFRAKTFVAEYSMKDLCNYWNSFGNIPVGEDGRILVAFLGFEAGTETLEVLKWFEGQNAKFSEIENGEHIGQDHPYWSIE